MSKLGFSNTIYLSEDPDQLEDGASFLADLDDDTRHELRLSGTRTVLGRGQLLFSQGDRHSGVWLIESGQLRTFYVGHQGREITLAYWTRGHFVGGPEIFGGGAHVWSADAYAVSTVTFLPGTLLRRLAERHSRFALALIDGLVAKGKCYSALVQMLATKSATERLEQLLGILASTHGRPTSEGILIDRLVTQDELAQLLGTSRQWLSASMEKLRQAGVVSIEKRQITLRRQHP